MKTNQVIKRLTAFALGCAILCSSTMGAYANPTFKRSRGQDFSSEWERTVNLYYRETNALVGTMIFGFDKTYINEDYVWTQSLSYYAKPILKNANGNFPGVWKKGSLSGYSKMEVAHSGENPKYKIRLRTNESKDNFKVSSKMKSNVKLRQ